MLITRHRLILFFPHSMGHYRSLLMAFACLLPLIVNAQIDTLPAQYPFLNLQANQIQSPQGLASFFTKLQQLENGSNRQVRIAHIGDSHVQADYMSSTLRHLFQDQFGNAGRGLVFFYRQAGTHGPLDIVTESPQTWDSRRRIFQKGGPAIGISGMGIATSSPAFELQLSPKKRDELFHFTKVSLFHNGNNEYQYSWRVTNPNQASRQIPMQANWRNYTVRSGDNLYKVAKQYNVKVDDIRRWNNLPNNLIFPGQDLSIQLFAQADCEQPQNVFLPTTDQQVSIVQLPLASNSLSISGKPTSDNAKAQIYGVLLEDETTPGILFNMMGVNGATYYHFNHAEHFMKQLAYLQPDLVLVTLGTNEAIQKRFHPEQFRKEVAQFLTSIKDLCPQASILLMTNPDVLVQRRSAAPFTDEVRKIIMETATQQQVSIWDLQSIMGGPGSIRGWKEAELGHHDFIHFTKKGYILQARLLHEAIIKEYSAGN